jgi:hypothetical protein
LLGSCSLGSGLRSRSLALNKDNAWWGSSVSTAGAGPYRKALAREQEIKGVPAIEGMPAEVVPADSGPFPSARVGSRPAVGNLAIEGCRTGRGPFSCLARARPSPAPRSITPIQRHSDQPHCAGGALSAHRILLFRGPVRRIIFFCLWETRTAWVTDRGAREIAVGGPNPGPGDGKRKGLWSDPGPFLFGSITPRQRTTARLR